MTAAGAPDEAAEAIRLLVAQRRTVGTAESLTGGLVASALTSVPGASAVFRGGIVAYAADLKTALLGVPAELLDRVGTVHADVAVAMARGVMDRLGVDVGIATTGVAGPDPVDGHPVGTVHIAVTSRARAGTATALAVGTEVRVRHVELKLSGDRGQIRRDTVQQSLSLLVAALQEDNA